MSERITTALELLGLAAVVAGVAWIYLPAGLITFGVLTILISVLSSGGGSE